MDLSRIQLSDSEPLDDAYLRLIDDLRAEGAEVHPLERYNAQSWLAPHLRIIAYDAGEGLFYLVVRAQRWTEDASWAAYRALHELREGGAALYAVANFAPKAQVPGPAAWYLRGTPECRFIDSALRGMAAGLNQRSVIGLAETSVVAAAEHLGEEWDLDRPEDLGAVDAFTLSRRSRPPPSYPDLPMPGNLCCALGAVVGEMIRRVAPDAVAWEYVSPEPGLPKVLRLRADREERWLQYITVHERMFWLSPLTVVAQRYSLGERAPSYVAALEDLLDFLSGRAIDQILLRPRRGP